MPRISFSDGLAIAGVIFAVILVVLDKGGKLAGVTLFVLLGVAALMTLPLALGNTWVADAPPGKLHFFRGMFMLCAVGLIYSGIAAWISEGYGEARITHNTTDPQSSSDEAPTIPPTQVPPPTPQSTPPAATPDKDLDRPKKRDSPKHSDPPLFADLRMTQHLVPSDKPDLPFAQEITVQTAVAIQPVAVVVKCDGEIGDGRGGVGAGMYTKTKQGVVDGHPGWYLISFESPAFTPQAPLVVTLFSKQAIKALSIEQVQFVWP